MKRRVFLQRLGTATTFLIADGRSARPAQPDFEPAAPPKIFVEKNDEKIGQILASQEVDRDSPFFGGFADQHHIYHVGQAAWNVCHLAIGYLSPESAYCQSDEVEQRLAWTIEFVRARQHQDGTIDLLSTNFHSPPDTGFVVEPIALALSCIRRHAPESLSRFQSVAIDFLSRAGRALAQGGVHTPNHRWVVCMALARIHQLQPDERLVKRVDQWLAEGIDIDADGQYTEKSTGVYSPLVDRCLITVARLLQRKDLYEPVRRNLEMTQYLVRPNGELVTEISRRQDQYRVRLADAYYYPYRFMAVLDQSAAFSAMARCIEQTVGKKSLYKQLFYGMEDQAALAPLPRAAPRPTDYERYFAGSQVVRIRRREVDASILADNPTFFSLHKGRAVLQALRIATAFFGKGQFVSESIERQDGAYILSQQFTAPYAQPLAPDLRRDDGDWSRMANTRRVKSEVQQLHVTLTVQETHGTFTLHVSIQGTERVPWALEAGFRHGGALSGVTQIQGVDDAFVAGDELVTYRLGEDVIHISSGPVEHRWTQLRGALPKLDAQCVYFTGFSPGDFELTIT